ncbi:hypothetical protein KUCAC02_002313 [Chaenocephalus aceratus]|uniref:Uncharacterized protein n=1 Tax=Chaenocephalus aceratus TaxID=36190 RepID=A0ACB9XV62_CHAAC|nr:hypothetical protein KUCAC02_002313 [Chaenocephalus aceratus]
MREIAHCPQCQAKRTNIKEKLEYSPIEVTEPFELVGMDLVGKLTLNSGLCETLNIKRSLCSAYHPQTNGRVEKLNGTIQRCSSPPCLLFGPKYSPYYLMFGREARYPSEVPKEYLVKEEKVRRLVEMEEIHEGLKKQEAVFRGKWLEGEIVNSYLTMVGRKAGALLIDSYLMTSLWEGNYKGSLRSLDLFKHDVAVGAIMYLKERRSLYLDPFGATEAQIEKCKDVTRALVRKKCPAIGRWACATVAHPKQQDSASCGVFVCKLAEQILSGQTVDYLVDQKGVAMLRLDMAMSLVTNADYLSQLCRACGELSSGADIDTWVCRETHVLTNLLLEDWDAPWIGYLNITG